MTFWRLHYHIVWTTRRRAPLLVDDIERQIYGTLREKADDLNLVVHAMGGLADHVHLVVSIPPSLSVSECVRQLKGASAYYVNHQPNVDSTFRWQRGYGVLSFGDRSMSSIVAYVQNQKQYHENDKTIAIYERITDE